MAIPESILSEMKCCLSKDYHVAIEPVFLKCGANACKDCIDGSVEDAMKCFSCNDKHQKTAFKDSPINKMTESVIQFFLKNLFEDLDNKISLFKQEIKDSSLNDDFQIKVENIEMELETKAESLIKEINKYKDEGMLQLRKCKLEFRSLTKRSSMDKLKGISEEEKNENSYEVFKKKQNELKKYKMKLKSHKDFINELKFIPSKFEMLKEHFGEIQYGFQHKIARVEKVLQIEKSDVVEKPLIKVIGNPLWLADSLILNKEEALYLAEFTNASHGALLYRATRDNFSSASFHLRCDGKANTITIIKTNTNFVFGGYTAAKWTSDRNYSCDPAAFIFSLRRNGVSNKEKFMIKSPEYAILGYSSYGPIFGSGIGSENDFYICDSSNIDFGSFASIGHSYECPTGHKYGDIKTANYLTGRSIEWLTLEIEVYQAK